MRLKVFLAFYLYFFCVNAQNIDSLRLQLNLAKQDSTRLQLNFEIGKAQSIKRINYWDSLVEKAKTIEINANFKGRLILNISQLQRKQLNFLQAINYANIALDYFLVANNTKSVCNAYNDIASCYSMQDNYNNALSFYNSSYLHAKEHRDTLSMGIACLKSSTINFKKGDYASSLNDGYRGLRCFEQVKDSVKIIQALKNIGGVYYMTKDLKKALNIGFKCLAITERINNENEKLSALNNIGTVYSSSLQYSLALSYHLKGLQLAEQQQALDMVAYIASNIGVDYQLLKQYPKAIFYLEKAIQIGNDIQDDFTIEHSLFTLGEIYFQQTMLSKAENYWLQSLQKADELKDLEGIQLSHNSLSKLYEKQNNLSKSLFHYKAGIAARDSLYNEENAKKLVKTEMDYEFQQKELAYKLEKEKISAEVDKQIAIKNSILIAIAGLLLISAGVVYYVYRTYKQKQLIKEYEKNNLKQKLLVSQMNPHFIYNSIDNIQALIYNNENDLAVNYLHHFSRLTRQIVEHSSETYIAFADELNMIENYLKIQQLLFQNSFEYSIDIDEAIDQEYTLVPPMLAQPFIENAIKHGLKGKTAKGEIDISFTLKNKILFFEITDNGKGFSDEKTTNHKSLAIKITQERLQSLSGKKQNKINVENIIGEGEIILGAKIEFEIPYFYEKPTT